MPPDAPPAPAPATPPVLGAVARDAAELADAVRREFERTLLERYGQPPTQDPTLAALFHAGAAHLAGVYTEAEQVFPEAVLDDLVAGLGFDPRLARPAQTVVGFAAAEGPELVTPDAPLVGVTPQGERLAFAPDLPVRVGPARLVFAAVTEGARLHVVPGATLPDDPRRAGGAPIPLPSGVAPMAASDAARPPTLLLAFDAVDDAHLGGLGLFVDVQGADHGAARALARATWSLVSDAAAEAPEMLALRPRAGPGAWLLEWIAGSAAGSDAGATGGGAVDARAPAGAYAALCWRWPDVPAERRVRARPPHDVAAVLDQVVPLDFVARYDRPLVWVRATLPAGARGVAGAVQRVVAHAAPASNVEAFHERVDLAALGPVVAFRPEGARGRHLVRVLAITGEHGARYADEGDVTAPAAAGTYRVRAGELEIRPAAAAAGRADRYVLARLLYTDGPRANGLLPGDVVAVGAGPVAATSLTVARGGAAPPAYAPARRRVARTLQTRERVVTPADVDAAACAFDPRVIGAGARAGVELGAPGVPPRPVLRVTAAVRRADFASGSAERLAFAAALERHLAARAPLGTAVRVQLAVLERDRRRVPRAGA